MPVLLPPLTIFNCAGYGAAGRERARRSRKAGPDLWLNRCPQPGVGNLPMILASLALCGCQIYLADSVDHGRRDWLVLAAAP